MWMNEDDVYDARDRFHDDPVLGPATKNLLTLLQWTNNHSDGWAHWYKPSQAADKLMSLVQRAEREQRSSQTDFKHTVTAVEVRKALVPVKAFRTRIGKRIQETFDLVDVSAVPEPEPVYTGSPDADPNEGYLSSDAVGWVPIPPRAAVVEIAPVLTPEQEMAFERRLLDEGR